jgi:hypothetical protein
VTNCCFERSSAIPVWFDRFNGLLKPVVVPHHSEF